MRAHLFDGEFQSDKYPTCPRGKVPLSVKDVTAQDLLWEYAQRRRAVDAEFADDLETALTAAGIRDRKVDATTITDAQILRIARLFRDGTATDAIWRGVAIVALGLTLDSKEIVAEARERLANIWNRVHES